ncbi:MAG: S-methyl-5-thioribose-1-phosphate isomerase [Candidatus Omnitrophica bacterium]|nr:S-methyl-5-thioribose-1-phosphate isomerase [Candidatus Omnitrophota bacterium]
MKLETVKWDNGSVVIIDQTRLPGCLRFLRCRTAGQVREAIRTLQVRGAPAIGAAAGLGLVLGIGRREYRDFSAFEKKVDEICAYLCSARPTAVNLAWALERVRRVMTRNQARPVGLIRKLMLAEALEIIREDKQNCRAMAGHAQAAVKKNARILTYCNAGMLATIDYGTALGVIYRAQELKKNVTVYACETRPLLQGARLTCWELRRKRVNVTLICDNMAGYLMQQKKIDLVIIGADRIAANGDTANKIGSYTLAVLARFHRIPLYVTAPRSTFDLRLKTGRQIPVEQRDAAEVRSLWFKRPMAAEGVKIYNPAFDIIPAGLISGIVTETGIITPPYTKNIRSRMTA